MSNTIEPEHERSEHQQPEFVRDTSNDSQRGLSEASRKFSDEVKTATISNRYDTVKTNTRTELTTATILDAESVTDKSVTLRVEHDGEQDYFAFYSETSHRQPKITDLVNVTDANRLHAIEGEELTILPNGRHEIEGCSLIENRLRRTARIIAIRTGLGGLATHDHPYSRQNDTTPTPKGLAVLSGVTVASGASVILLAGAVSTAPTVLAVPLFGLLMTMLFVFCFSWPVAAMFGLLAGKHLIGHSSRSQQF